MTTDEIKAILYRSWEAQAEIEKDYLRMATLRSNSEKMTQTLSFAPVHGGSEDKLFSSVSKILELETKIIQKRQRLKAILKSNREIIEGVTSKRQRYLLKLRYVYVKSWNDIFSITGKTPRAIYYLHERAIKEAATQYIMVKH